MSVFTSNEIAYLRSQPLGRFATVGGDGRPSVRPVGVLFDAEDDVLVIGGVAGSGMAGSKKFRDVVGNPDVSFLVDDLASVDPWAPRGIEVRGRAEPRWGDGPAKGLALAAPFPFDEAWMVIRPRRVLSWGLDGDSFDLAARTVTPAGRG
ncbi:PPOX class F420-dependent oxidoreductase [Actinoalloteichus hymeniacidonis]|jgi:pyridoxamine 5'-phosphate oxidase family protein|uniref:PPOX class putative F420-dependent enzyme n=1 Tax=Actinoalloteichus hymeniacidonis TaxID=340345 RepID=A0AAC9HQJ1_9PSEU|nr:PPOX class F420-dependent oxidoreductase [Actinoalloteichus hymeniacidonis]AOS63580.1 PPOX class putative F420-dependent enzyme [Actinoalloteichus hymeniacidonis]MBB5908374.1 pyridoxamine 5'-phosphate oxidase family protein [Actinoalloteichus hymeniacidonis]